MKTLSLETERLEIIPLTARQLGNLVNDLPALEEELNVEYKAEPVVGHFKKILEGQIPLVENGGAYAFFYTFWLIVRKSDRVVVGSIDYKNAPAENGEVEIEYGLEKPFEHNGYMTEAVKAFCRFALSLSEVQHITAETDLTNIPSQNVLKRCKFVEYRRDKSVWWRL